MMGSNLLDYRWAGMCFGALVCCGITFPNLGSLASHEYRAHGTAKIVPKGINTRKRYPIRFKALVLEAQERWLSYVCTRCESSWTPELMEKLKNQNALAKKYEYAEQEEEMQEEEADAARPAAEADAARPAAEAIKCTGCGNCIFKRKYTHDNQVNFLSLSLFPRSLAQ